MPQSALLPQIHALHCIVLQCIAACLTPGNDIELIALHCYPTLPSVIGNGVARTNCICLQSLFRSAARHLIYVAINSKKAQQLC